MPLSVAEVAYKAIIKEASADADQELHPREEYD